MSRVRSTTTAPDEDCIARGVKCCCQIDRGSRGRSGKVWYEQGIVRWQYGVRGNPSGRGRGNPFNKPDFVIADPDGQKELLIRRVSFLPSVFHMVDEDKVIGRICMGSLLRN